LDFIENIQNNEKIKYSFSLAFQKKIIRKKNQIFEKKIFFFFEKKIYKNEILFLHTFTHSKIRPELKKQNFLKFTFSYTPVSQGRS